jgi:hypothetical protein
MTAGSGSSRLCLYKTTFAARTVGGQAGRPDTAPANKK